LVKLNIDDHPSIPGQLGIQSIPAVVAFVDGRPVDGFMGAVPESQVRQFIDKIAGAGGADAAAEIASVVEEAKQLLDQGNVQEAAHLNGAEMQADPANAKAIAGFAQCLIAADQQQKARQMLEEANEEVRKDPDVQAALKKIGQAEEVRE